MKRLASSILLFWGIACQVHAQNPRLTTYSSMSLVVSKDCRDVFTRVFESSRTPSSGYIDPWTGEGFYIESDNRSIRYTLPQHYVQHDSYTGYVDPLTKKDFHLEYDNNSVIYISPKEYSSIQRESQYRYFKIDENVGEKINDLLNLAVSTSSPQTKDYSIDNHQYYFIHFSDIAVCWYHDNNSIRKELLDVFKDICQSFQSSSPNNIPGLLPRIEELTTIYKRLLLKEIDEYSNWISVGNCDSFLGIDVHSNQPLKSFNPPISSSSAKNVLDNLSQFLLSKVEGPVYSVIEIVNHGDHRPEDSDLWVTIYPEEFNSDVIIKKYEAMLSKQKANHNKSHK